MGCVVEPGKDGAGPVFFCGSTPRKRGSATCHVSFRKKMPGKKVKLADIEAYLVRETLPNGPVFMCKTRSEPTDAEIRRWEREIAALDEDDGGLVPSKAPPRRGRRSQERAPLKTHHPKRRAR